MTHPTPRFTGRNGTRNYIAYIVADAERSVQQALWEGRVARGETTTWQENALERAGDYALAGEWSESRRMAEESRS